MFRSYTTFSHPLSLSSTSNSLETYSPDLLVRLIATDSPVWGSIAWKTYPEISRKEPLDTENQKWIKLTEATRTHKFLGANVQVPCIAAVFRQLCKLTIDLVLLCTLLHDHILLLRVLLLILHGWVISMASCCLLGLHGSCVWYSVLLTTISILIWLLWHWSGLSRYARVLVHLSFFCADKNRNYFINYN